MKILKNNTVSNISIMDTGITINASSQYVVPAQDYNLWAASSNIITKIGSGDIIVNDGSVDLSISDGTDVIKGLHPKRIEILSGDNANSIGSQTYDGKKFFNTIAANQVISSSSNSSTSNLTSGATFTGTAEQILYSASAQVSLKSDQDCYLEFQQSPDGTNWDISDGHVIYANVGDSRTFQITQLYVRVKVKNLGTSTTTYLRLSTIYTAQMEALPRSLSQDGRLKVETLHHSDLNSPLGRLRTTEHHTFFEFSHKRGVTASNNIFDEQVVSGGNTTDITNQASIEMNTTSTIGSKVIRSTYRYFPYFPGRGTTVLFTGNFKGATAGIRKRYGYFDDKDGMYFELNGSTFNVIRRSYVTGSPVNDVVSQANWNTDTLDGTGPSGETFNLSGQTIFFIELLWLGSGPVHMGCYIGNKKIYVHKFQASNALSEVWASTASLPIRAEIENLSGNQASTLRLTCMSIIYEGEIEPESGLDHFHISSDLDEKTVTTDTPVWSIRLNPNTNRSMIIPVLMNIIMTSGTKVLYWKLIKNATLTGASWSNWGIFGQLDTATTSYSGGAEIMDGYVNIGGSTTISQSVFLNDQEVFIGRKIDGTSETLTLVASTSGGTAKFVWDAKIREYLL